MKKLFIIFLLLCSVVTSFAADYKTPAGGAQEYTDVGFANISAISIKVGQGLSSDLAYKIGDGDTGFYENVDDSMVVVTGGVIRSIFVGDAYRTSGANGFYISKIEESATVAPYTFAGDIGLNTGMGRAGEDQLSHIAGGVEGSRTYKNGVDLKVAVAFSGISSIVVDYVMGNFTTDPTFFIECDAALGNISTTLPPVADKSGRLIEMILTSATNGCYFDGKGAETINGATGQSITTRWNVISLIAGATQWLIR